MTRPSHRRSPREPGESLDDLKARLGLTDEQLREAPLADGEPWKKHAELDEDADCAGTMRWEDKTGPMWFANCDACNYGVGVPMLKNDPEKLRAHRMEHSGIPDVFRGKDFDRSDPAQRSVLDACRAYVTKFKTEPLPGIALWGEPGRGKSHLLALMVETLIKRYGIAAIYRTAVELFDELKQGMDEGDESSRWERLQNAAVLVIDDLGAEQMTDWKRERLVALLEHRIGKELPVLFATNLPPRQWEGRFGARATSRLRGLCVPLELKGKDRRWQGVQERLG